MDRKLRKAVVTAGEGAGSYSRIAAALGLTRQTVAAWQRVPAEHVITVEEVSGIPRHELRPDIYPPPEAGVSPQVT